MWKKLYFTETDRLTGSETEKALYYKSERYPTDDSLYKVLDSIMLGNTEPDTFVADSFTDAFLISICEEARQTGILVSRSGFKGRLAQLIKELDNTSE